MTDQDSKESAPLLLDRPGEERLLAEIESLRRELDKERRLNKQSRSSGEKALKRPARKTLLLLAAFLLAILALAFFLGFVPRHRREKQLEQQAKAEREALPVVSFIYAQRSPSSSELSLPGNSEALTEAPILARADGYVRKRYVDIGDRVTKGQLLAEIDAPDLDQEVHQARAQLRQSQAALKQAVANLDQGKANQTLAHVTAVRWGALLKRGAVSRQENDQYQASDQAQTANVGSLAEAVSGARENASAAQANLDRLLELQAYKQVRAPFSGVITLRNIDVGALISTGSTLLFRVAQIDRLRTYIYVPQSNAPTVQVGQMAILQVLERPERRYNGQITRTASSLDPATRTLLTEVQVPNPDKTLLPGMFVDVTLTDARLNPPVLIPGDTLVIRSNGTFVAVLTEIAKGNEDAAQSEGRQQKAQPESRQDSQSQQELPTFSVRLASVKIGRDYGNEIEVVTGLNGGERVVVNPNDSVRDNAKVKAMRSTQVPGETSNAPGAKQGGQTEKLSPQTGAEPPAKEPNKEQKTRGPG